MDIEARFKQRKLNSLVANLTILKTSMVTSDRQIRIEYAGSSSVVNEDLILVALSSRFSMYSSNALS